MTRRALRRPGTPSGQVRVTPVPTESAALLTVGPGALCWGGDLSSLERAPWAGALVRVRPPPGVPDATLAAVTSLLRERGAGAVVVERAPAVGLVAAEAQDGPVLGQREAVMALAAASRFQDKPALLVLLEEIMEEVGL